MCIANGWRVERALSFSQMKLSGSVLSDWMFQGTPLPAFVLPDFQIQRPNDMSTHKLAFMID